MNDFEAELYFDSSSMSLLQSKKSNEPGKTNKKLHVKAITRNSFTKIKHFHGTKIMVCNSLLKVFGT